MLLAELNSATIEEIKEVLIDQGVSEVQRREGERRIPTSTYFLTFNRPKLPEEIVVLDFLGILEGKNRRNGGQRTNNPQTYQATKMTKTYRDVPITSPILA